MVSQTKKHFYSIVSFFALVAVVASLFTFVSPVYASTPPTGIYSYLMGQYKSEQLQLTAQVTVLMNTRNERNTLTALITKGEAAGEDISELTMTMQNFSIDIEVAEKNLELAHSVLSTHNGFDNNGNITDPYAAGLTVSAVQQALNDCHNALLLADHTVNKGMNDWVHLNNDINDWLNKNYQFDQGWLYYERLALNNRATLTTNTQNMITRENGKGKNTTDLVSALSAFQSKLASAQSSYNTAAGILTTHTGFDAKGNVMNQSAARATVNSAGQALGTAEMLFKQATTALNQAIQAWNKSH
ncbi:MAG TPA: hypothetical protein VKF38_03815 [Anaerolineaceae bacterium]|nr:hypothetical protein [Anaerolineaceae bacterium]